ncbi:hypothetical protein KSP40_PGU015226 [Platanthera guangdongensis]|uniref:Importin N-terminal domain-containing protein n=1 Tax=Platanthera guangdongensis TaxID=2320717 RepID=A0ABR2M810_9ASPA
MDLPSLAIILQAALSPNHEERKAAEESLNQFQYTPQHLVRLLQIVVDGNCDLAVRQVASIHFKNFVAKNWSPDEPDEPQKISASDKIVVRENILGFIIQVPQLLRAQLGECLKTIVHADYPEQWPNLLHWIKCNLQLQDQQVLGALYVLRILSRKYEFKSDEERLPVSHIVEETFPHLLNIFHKLIHINNPPIEVSDLIKLICKIFWSSIYLEIPKQLYDPNVFNVWMVHFLNILERSVPLEGQPTDPELRKTWGWWKVKKWTVHILNRLYTRFGDMKLQNPENKAFAQMFQKNYAGKILECHLRLLNAIRTGEYLPDRVINLVLQYLNCSISRGSMYQLLQPQMDIVLFEIIFPLMCFNDNDQRLWNEDPHEYVRKGYDIIEDLYSPRTAAMDFAAWVAGQYAYTNFSDQNNFRSALHCIVSGLKDPELPVRVDSIFALRPFVEACKDLDELRPMLPQLLDDFFKLMNEVENEDLVFTLETIVDKFGEEMAPYAIGLCQNLAAAFWRCLNASEADDEGDDSGALAAVGCLRAISTILESVNSLPQLYVQIEPTLLPIMRKMLSTDGQDVFEEVLEMVSYMTFYSPSISLEMWSLWPLMIASLNEWAIDYFENILVPLDNYISRGTAHFLACKEPDYQQSLWNMLSSIMADKNMEDNDIQPAPKLIQVMFQNCKGQVDQWVEPDSSGFGSNGVGSGQSGLRLDAKGGAAAIKSHDRFGTICDRNRRTGCHGIAGRSIGIWAALRQKHEGRNVMVLHEDVKGFGRLCGRSSESGLLLAVGNWLREEMGNGSMNIGLAPPRDPQSDCRLWIFTSLAIPHQDIHHPYIADALYYNGSLTLGILHKLGVSSEIFNMWFQMLQEVKKSGVRANFRREFDKKVCCLGLTSLIALSEEQLPAEALGRVFCATLELLASYKVQVAEAKKEAEAESDDVMDGFQTDDDEEDESDREMGDDDDEEEGDEADSRKLKKIAAQAKGLQPEDEDADDSDDDYSDNEEMQSPIDNVDAFIFFVETVKGMQAANPTRFQNLMQMMNFNHQALASGIAQHAEQRRIEIEQERIEKAAST